MRRKYDDTWYGSHAISVVCAHSALSCACVSIDLSDVLAPCTTILGSAVEPEVCIKRPGRSSLKWFSASAKEMSCSMAAT